MAMTTRYMTGKYGEMDSNGIGGLEQSHGYPVFRTYSDKPHIKHSQAWFVYEQDAKAYCVMINDILSC